MGTRAGRERSVLALLFGLALGPAAAFAQPHAETLVGLTLERTGGGLTAILEADGIINHRVYVMEDPPRVVVDVLDVRNEVQALRPTEPHPLLRQVLTQQLSMTAYDAEAKGRTFARITFELKVPARPSARLETGRLELVLRSVESTGTMSERDAVVTETSGDGGGVEAAPSTPTPSPVAASDSAGVDGDELQQPGPGDPAAFSPAQWIEPADVSPDVFFGPRSGGSGQYLIGPDDVLEIRVFELDELNRTARVEADGMIILPLVGPVRVGGLTAPKAGSAVAARLRGDFIDDPQVTIRITEYQSRRVSFLGAVARPGTYPLVGQRGLLELLASAEGLSPAAGSSLYVFRKLPDGRSARLSVPLHELLVLGNPVWNIALEPGDVVSVPPEDAISVSVVGAVGSPGVYKLPVGNGATLLRAIALAGGLQPRASKNIQVKRPSSGGEETVIKVDLGDIMSGKRADFILEEGDVVIVNQSFF